MLLSLCFCALVLCLTAGNPDVNSTAATGLDGLTRTVEEFRTAQQLVNDELNQTTQLVKTGLQRTAEDVARLDQTTHELQVGQKQMLQAMQRLQEQLTEVQQRLTSATPPEACPAGWSRHGQACYLVPQQRKNWRETEMVCASRHPNAQLASIPDPATTEHARRVARVAGDENVWIGLYRPHDKADWRWNDGTPLNYTNWPPGHSWGGWRWKNQNCVALDDDAYWSDSQCHLNKRSLCQIKLG